MPAYLQPEHRAIAELLRLTDAALFEACRCWFGGGTAIVMRLGEYRLSRDVDFLCSDADGYRILRERAVGRGIEGFFAAPVSAMREARCDQYGIRSVLSLHGIAIRFEIVREARIDVAGAFDADFGCPVLAIEDQFAEKLLANADRCQDTSTAYRDFFDLGMLVRAHGGAPAAAVDKAERAYGGDIRRKVRWVVDRLAERRDELRSAAASMQMSASDAELAFEGVAAEARRLWGDGR